MQEKVWYHEICTVKQRRLKNINIAWQTFLFLELGTGRWNKTKTSELSGRKKMAATEEQSTATRRTQNDEPEGSLRFNHVAKTEMGKAGPQTILTSLRKSFSLFGHRRNWVSAKNKEDKGKTYDPRSLSHDIIMQTPSTKDLTNSHRLLLVIIKYMSGIAETIAITAVIVCNNQTFGIKKCAAIMRITFALSKLKRGKQCCLHRKRFLKNIVSFTPIHKDEQITKINSEEIISMFRWVAVLTVKGFNIMFSEKPSAFSTNLKKNRKKKISWSCINILELCFGKVPRVISRKRPPFLGIYGNFLLILQIA